MSESQVNHNSQNQNPPAAGSAPAGGTPPTPAVQTQNTPQVASATSQPAVNQVNHSLQFQSNQIGTQTASKNDPFAEHKQKATAKKEKNAKNRRIIIICAAVAVLLILVGLVLLVINLKNKSSNETAPVEEIPITEDIYSQAQEISQLTDGNEDEVAQFFADALADPANAAIYNQILESQLMYYYNNNKNEDALAVLEMINIEQLSLGEQSTLYNALQLIYQAQGDMEKSNYYGYQGYKIAVKLDAEAKENNE